LNPARGATIAERLSQYATLLGGGGEERPPGYVPHSDMERRCTQGEGLREMEINTRIILIMMIYHYWAYDDDDMLYDDDMLLLFLLERLPRLPRSTEPLTHHSSGSE